MAEERELFSNVRVFPLKKQGLSIKANGKVTVAGLLDVSFKVMDTGKGLWISWPARQGETPDPETGKKPWYPDVSVVDQEVGAQLTDYLVQAYKQTLTNGGTTTNKGTKTVPAKQTPKQEGIPF